MILMVFCETAPYLLIGLFFAGWMKIIIPTRGVHAYLGKANLRSALYAALFGLPLPICSCGVVPLTIGLREKGASRESNLSFMISTPETSIDTVIITWGLLGPIMALVRPVIALLTSMFAAVLSIAERTDREDRDGDLPSELATGVPAVAPPEGEPAYVLEDGYHVVGPRGFWQSLTAALRKLPAFSREEEAEDSATKPVPLGTLLKDANRYAFHKMLDDISFWLVIGIIAAGLIAALVPSTWFESLPGGELGNMVFILLISVPLYVCAVESTPIAAILILKGLSPGAALVFLLAGPATNLATMLLLHNNFGKRFLRLYLFSIAVVSIAAGLALNALLGVTGLEVISGISSEGAFGLWSIFSIFASIVLLVLLGFSFYRMDWQAKRKNARGFSDRLLAFFGLLLPEKTPQGKEGAAPKFLLNRRRLTAGLLGLALAAWLLSGFYTVPPGSAGYQLRLGKLVAADLPPGLHYHLPWPLGKVHKYRIAELRKTDLGFRTDIQLLAKWKSSNVRFNPVGWHSFFTTMNVMPEESIYLMGDENQLEAKFAIHYRLSDPTAFFFFYAKNKDLVSLTVESVARELLAGQTIDKTLTDERGKIIPPLMHRSQELLDRYGIGVTLQNIYLVDLHPPIEAVAAFRDVASAMEDRQTRIHRAYEKRSSALPKARGDAANIKAVADAYAYAARSESEARAESFLLRAEAYHNYPQATRYRMYLETMEAVLPGVDKIIAPSAVTRDGRLRLWKSDGGLGMMQLGE